jgi:hypothetical protein
MTPRQCLRVRRLRRTFSHLVRAMVPTLIAMSIASVAHAQGTMDFSGAQTLMGTFKTLAAYIRRADEGTLSRLLVETTILLTASRSNPATILRDAASMYKVDTDAITLKVKQEFAAKEKAKKTPQSTAKAAKKAA